MLSLMMHFYWNFFFIRLRTHPSIPSSPSFCCCCLIRKGCYLYQMPLCHLLRSSSFTLSGAGQSIGSDENLTFCSKDASETSSVRKTRENTQSWNICHEQELTLVVQNNLERPLISCCYLIFNLCTYSAKSFAYKCGRSPILRRTKLREKTDTDHATCGHWYSLIPVQ